MGARYKRYVLQSSERLLRRNMTFRHKNNDFFLFPLLIDIKGRRRIKNVGRILFVNRKRNSDGKFQADGWKREPRYCKENIGKASN
jgi:hypothetical protein